MANITDVKLPDNSQYDLKDNVSGYASKVSSATTNDLASLTATGDLADSGKKLSDLVLKSDVKDVLNSTSTTDPLSANQGRVLAENLSHRNLFDNPWFTINQRGASGIISGANVYGYDRWCQAGAGGGYSATSDGPIILITMWQRVEDNSFLQGKEATFTMLYADGEITSGTGTIGSTITTSDGSTLDFPTNQYNISAGNTTKAVRAVKLELGSVSTLHLDAAPDYTTELLKCQRFFFRLTATAAGQPLFYGMCNNATESTFALLLPTAMRTSPTLTYAGSWGIYEGTSDYPLTLFYLGTCYPQNIYFATKVGSSVLTKGQCVCVRSGASGDYIELSADL